MKIINVTNMKDRKAIITNMAIIIQWKKMKKWKQ
jgi:hypothetical protein